MHPSSHQESRAPTARGYRGLVLHVANGVSAALPSTRGFSLRNLLFRASGISIDPEAKILGRTWIYYPNVSIGASWLGAGTQIYSTPTSRVTIGDRCDIGPGVMFVTGSHVLGDSCRRAGEGTSEPIELGSGTWVGARATFLGGASVGPGSVVAAGALVRDAFPANVLIAGTPARIVKTLA